MTLRYFLFLLFQIALTVVAQDQINISGLVVNDSDGSQLPFAQVSLSGTNLGTVSNEEGRFTIDIPTMFSGDSLAVAYMGFVTEKFPISALKGNPSLIIRLKQGQLQLSEVEIVSMSSEEVIRQVVAHIPENYGADSLILTAFIRSQKFVNGKLAEFTEAMIEDLKTGYSHYPAKKEAERRKNSNVPFLVKGRVISDTGLVNVMGDIGKNAGCLGCNFIHDFAEFYHNTVLDEALFEFYTFRMEELVQDGRKLYHIWFDQRKGVKKTLWKGELFVNADDFALIKLTQKPSFEAYETYEKGKRKTLYVINNRYGWYKEMPRMEWTTTYSRRSDHYYLSAIRIENWLTFVYQNTGEKVKFAHKNEVVVTDASRQKETIRNFKGDKSTGVNQRWDQVVGKADQDFWVNFNYLPIESTLLQTLKTITPE